MPIYVRKSVNHSANNIEHIACAAHALDRMNPGCHNVQQGVHAHSIPAFLSGKRPVPISCIWLCVGTGCGKGCQPSAILTTLQLHDDTFQTELWQSNKYLLNWHDSVHCRMRSRRLTGSWHWCCIRTRVMPWMLVSSFRGSRECTACFQIRRSAKAYRCYIVEKHFVTAPLPGDAVRIFKLVVFMQEESL